MVRHATWQSELRTNMFQLSKCHRIYKRVTERHLLKTSQVTCRLWECVHSMHWSGSHEYAVLWLSRLIFENCWASSRHNNWTTLCKPHSFPRATTQRCREWFRTTLERPLEWTNAVAGIPLFEWVSTVISAYHKVTHVHWNVPVVSDSLQTWPSVYVVASPSTQYESK